MSRNIDRLARHLHKEVASLQVPRGVEEQFGAYKDDPVRFAVEVLGVERIPDYQRAFLNDVANHEYTAWVAGHAVGKSHAAAMLIAWYLVTRPGCRCVVTSYFRAAGGPGDLRQARRDGRPRTHTASH